MFSIISLIISTINSRYNEANSNNSGSDTITINIYSNTSMLLPLSYLYVYIISVVRCKYNMKFDENVF